MEVLLMLPFITVKKTFLGDSIQFNYVNKPYLTQNINLAPALFGESMDFYFSLPC